MIVAKLKQWRLTIAGCALMSGVAVGTLEDTRHWVISRVWAFLPSPPAQVACVDSYLGSREAKNTGQYRVALTQLSNDNDLSQTALMDRSLRRLYGEDLDGAIQLETVNCTLFSGTGNAGERVRAATELATYVAEKLDADVVIWGEVITSNQSINLRLSHVQGTEIQDYGVDEGVIEVDFGTDIATILAAKVATMSTFAVVEGGGYSIPLMRRVIELTTPLIEKTPSGISSHDLGSLWHSHALANHWIGEETGDNVKISEAIAAYRMALKVWARERDPLNWARAQHNLGTALFTLGEREGGIVQLEEAIAAYYLALEVRTRVRVPDDWAMTQYNLGTALRVLGQGEKGQQKQIQRLEQAVVAYHHALEEWTRERAPRDWAVTQHGLGNTFLALGERDSGTNKLEAAVEAYRLALEEHTREHAPLDWARVQFDLGTTLQKLSERVSDKKDQVRRLEGAILAFRFALEKWTRKSDPRNWAVTQHNLAKALVELGERESRREDQIRRMDEALAATRLALEERTREQYPFDWALSSGAEGVIKFRIAARQIASALEEPKPGLVRIDLKPIWEALEQIETAKSTLEDIGQADVATQFAEHAELVIQFISVLQKMQ